ncbi:MAG: hypothetical protein HOP15_01295 [Planctomycetes bacterium]|nr:hypothetical protein [Planctomycetota bacterium]
MDPELIRYFDIVCDRIAAHPSYSVKLEKAAGLDEQLVLNYHTHGPEQDYCASVCVGSNTLVEHGLHATLEELAHIRGIGATAEECGPRMAAFAACLVDRYVLKRAPLVLLDGRVFVGR